MNKIQPVRYNSFVVVKLKRHGPQPELPKLDQQGFSVPFDRKLVPRNYHQFALLTNPAESGLQVSLHFLDQLCVVDPKWLKPPSNSAVQFQLDAKVLPNRQRLPHLVFTRAALDPY